MPETSLYKVIWETGLQPELIYFCTGLNWLYIIILTTAFYGVTHTSTLNWFSNIIDKKWWKSNIMWFISIILFIVFIIFRFLEGNIVDAAYISSGLRSLFFTVVFSSIFVDIPVYVIKGLGKFIDTKSTIKDK